MKERSSGETALAQLCCVLDNVHDVSRLAGCGTFGESDSPMIKSGRSSRRDSENDSGALSLLMVDDVLSHPSLCPQQPLCLPRSAAIGPGTVGQVTEEFNGRTDALRLLHGESHLLALCHDPC